MITGTVTSLEPKDWKGTMLYAFKVDSNPRTFYRTGRLDPANFGVTVGARISFSVDAKNNVDVNSIAPAAASTVQQAPTVQRVAQQDNRQERIEAQSARRDAISTVSMLLQAGALKFPPKISEADKPAFIAGMVKEFSDHYSPYETNNLLETEDSAQDSLYD